MKKIILSALVATATLGTAASAMTDTAVGTEARLLLPQADFSGVTAAQAAQIDAIIHSGDNHNEKVAQIRGVLR